MHCASSGEEALDLAQRIRPQFALMDMRLGDALDGIDTAERLRQRFDVPSVFLTAYADEETIGRAKGAEPVNYLVKPFREPERRATIEVALRRAAIERRLRERNPWHYAILDTLRHPVILTDTTGRVTALNRAAEKMAGGAASEACGRPLAQLFTTLEAGQVGRLKEAVRQAVREKRAIELGAFWPAVGSVRNVFSAEVVLPMLEQAGVLCGAALVSRDRSEALAGAPAASPAAQARQAPASGLALDLRRACRAGPKRNAC